jgi:glutathione synthase/RimK-type ligase-like ATP-grasp enzyme
MRFLLLGNPENRRVSFFLEACRRIGLAEPVVVSWVDFLKNPRVLDDVLAGCDVLRIESSGENEEVEGLLLQRGGAPFLKYEKGRIRNQVAWYDGWKAALSDLSHLKIEMMNSPRQISLMFDKLLSQEHLRKAGVPVPSLFGLVNGADEVFRLLEESGAKRVFVKPRHSSSASGVVALQVSGERVLATTSVKMKKGKLFNSLKLSRYESREEVTELLDALGAENLMVEKWFPKATLNRRVTDFRVLVISGRARHVVARASRSPITNLHLGNARGDLDLIRDLIPTKTWELAMASCEKAAGCFPECLYVAVDLMIGANLESVAVAEVNAFGDLLPNLFSEGEDTYEAEIRAWMRR